MAGNRSAIFDVVVIGGGVIGSAAAAEISNLGHAVALVDRACIGSAGATACSGGILRTYDRDPIIRELSLLSTKHMTESRIGIAFASTIARTGVYLVPDTPVETDALKSGKLRLVSRRQAAEATGFLAADGQDPVIWEREGGHGNARSSARAMVFDTGLNVTVLENAGPFRIEEEASEVSLVFAHGRLRARFIVAAGGAWTAGIIRDAPIRARSIPQVRMVAERRRLPCPIIDFPAGSYLAPLGSRLVGVGAGCRSEAETVEGLTWPADAILEDGLARFIEISGQADLATAFDIVEGHDAYCADGRPVIGRLRDRRVFLATGFAGIGYKLAPAAGAIAAQLVHEALTGQPLDARTDRLSRALTPQRFPEPVSAKPDATRGAA